MEKQEVVIIGKKPLINYIDSISMNFYVKKVNELKIVAMGRLISTAFEAVEIARIKFLKKDSVEIKEIKCTSKIIEKECNGKKFSDIVPSVEITLVRKL